MTICPRNRWLPMVTTVTHLTCYMLHVDKWDKYSNMFQSIGNKGISDKPL